MKRKPLTDLEVKRAKPRPKPYKMGDSGGLYLYVTPAGGRIWRLKYRIGDKEKLLVVGPYPELSLSEAREEALKARKVIYHGQDPAALKKAAKEAARAEEEAVALTFGALAEDWRRVRLADRDPTSAQREWRRLELWVMPTLGAVPARDITPPMVLEVARGIEATGKLETAHRTLRLVAQVFDHALISGVHEHNPAHGLSRALRAAPERHFPAPVDNLERIGEILRMLDAYSGGVVVGALLRLQPLLFCRPGELRTARWADIDLHGCEWRYTASKTKQPHVVPLSSQALAILGELHDITGDGVFVFPGLRSGRPVSDMAALVAYRAAGIGKDELVPHGWRAVARTLATERLKYPAEVIELQLGHAVKDPLGRAYNRVQWLTERRQMMQAWADFLDKLKD